MKGDNGIPDGVTYDGPMNVGAKTLLCFTDLKSGSSFTVAPHEANFENIFASAMLKRIAATPASRFAE